MIELFLGAPDGAKACMIGCVLMMIICLIWLIHDAIEDSRNDEIHWRHGHGADRKDKRMHK